MKKFKIEFLSVNKSESMNCNTARIYQSISQASGKLGWQLEMILVYR